MAVSRAKAIVFEVVSEVFAGTGFTVDGSKRSCYEDHGWFVSLVDFQEPVGWQGSFLNVAGCFLWTPYRQHGIEDMVGSTLDFTLASSTRIDIDGVTRNGGGLECDGDYDEFRRKFRVMAQRGLVEGSRLRVFDDWVVAKDVLIPYTYVSESLWGVWNKAMLCFVTGDSHARYFLDKFSQFQDRYNEDIREFIAEQSRIFLGFGDDFEAAQRQIVSTVEANRLYLLEGGMTGFAPDWRLIPPALGSLPDIVLPKEPKRGWRRWFGGGGSS